MVVAPVNATLSMPGWATSGAPAVGPKPVTTLNTPGGKPASSTRRASSSVDAGVCSAGFTTMVQPAARAGASFHVSSSSGEFHGVTAPTTPTGSRRVYTKKFDRSDGIVCPWILSAAPAKYR